jgi:hypothetical protein
MACGDKAFAEIPEESVDFRLRGGDGLAINDL